MESSHQQRAFSQWYLLSHCYYWHYESRELIKSLAHQEVFTAFFLCPKLLVCLLIVMHIRFIVIHQRNCNTRAFFTVVFDHPALFSATHLAQFWIPLTAEAIVVTAVHVLMDFTFQWGRQVTNEERYAMSGAPGTKEKNRASRGTSLDWAPWWGVWFGWERDLPKQGTFEWKPLTALEQRNNVIGYIYYHVTLSLW